MTGFDAFEADGLPSPPPETPDWLRRLEAGHHRRRAATGPGKGVARAPRPGEIRAAAARVEARLGVGRILPGLRARFRDLLIRLLLRLLG